MSSRNRRGGLGRGLGALIPTAPPDEAAEQTGAGRPMGYPPMPPYDGNAEPAAQPPSGDELPEPPADYQAGVPVREAPEPATEPDGEPSAEASADLSAEPPAESAPDQLVPVAGAQFVEVAVQEIRPNPKQPRQVFDEDALAELTHSIREFGVLQPIVVRRVDDGYELVMGERRLRAAATAGLTTVPAIVRTTADDAMLRDALLENIHRAQLNPLEEAAAYQQLLEEFGATHDELATRIGRSRPQVSNTIRLLNLPVPVQRRVAVGILSAGHARALLGIEDGAAQEDLAGRIVAEGLSVRATEELVALHASGDGARKAGRKASTPRITAPALVELADRLSDAFDTRVKVELGRTKGKITVEFATIDDLERIVLVMSGQLASQGEPPVRELDPSGPATANVAAEEGADSGPEPDAGSAEQSEDAGSDQEPGAPAAEAVGPDYAGWGGDHVPDLGAWDERIRYDPNES